MYDIEELNEVQKLAVLDTEGAVLVTAGAGSGKTRLLTHRIAHLINDCGVKPYNILAITFTNKAANEMRTRLEGMLDAQGIWIFTFHAACVRILRSYIDKIGFGKNFTIYGEAETKSVVKRICKSRGLTDDMNKRILSAISDAKNKGIAPSEYAAVFKFSQDADDIAAAYAEYQKALRANNALDYDDLLILTLKLLRENQEAREYYQNKFRFIHIDEFQDTNIIQYEIVKLLAQKHGNIFAVGDEDQCIYTWRGASIANIFDFQRDFKCKVYKLEQNYRSTTNILNVANRIIKGNQQRLDKKLWTKNPDGEKVVCYAVATEGFEADYVVKTIYELTHDLNYNYSDIAVLMRLNALTRPFEERFLQYGIPHRIYGGFKFYDRKEIKDVLAYARLAVNPLDDEAAYRIINFPKRHIGEASIEKLRAYAETNGLSVYDVVTSKILPFNDALNAKLEGFGEDIASLRSRVDGDTVDFFRHLLNNILNINDLFADDDENRLENLNELINSVREFAKNNPGGTVEDYLQTVSLYSDTDDMSEDNNAVTVATVHSAKGLEFPVVFVVALEDGVFPSIRMNETNSDHMEEERRLMYVAATRAKKRLYLTYSKSRYLYGETKYNIPSRFLKEAGLVEVKTDYRDVYTSSPSYGASSTRRTFDGFAKPTYTSDGGRFSGAYKSDYGKTAEQKQSAGGDKGVYIGATVMHRRLGKGKVIGLEKLGDNVYAKIDFETGGVMQLAVGFAPITVVEE
ncbi:MAG: UvrD-helicase domain-containing protein [Clostridiales bacterium]|nr:UvrD-helicase domain-containing protein [Clostridiales bacterium]